MSRLLVCGVALERPVRRIQRLIVPILILFPFVSAAGLRAQGSGLCPPDYQGYLPPRLALGAAGEIRADGVPNRVRETPALDGHYLFDIQPGSRFTLIAGPACADGVVWWRVDVDGQVGWTAESNTADRTYYLQGAETGVVFDALAPGSRPAITRDNLDSLSALPYPDLMAGGFDTAAFANLLVVADRRDAFSVYHAGNPFEALASVGVEGALHRVAVSPAASLVAVATTDLETQTDRITIYRYDPRANPDLQPLGNPFDLADEPTLMALAISPPYLVTAHGEDDAGLVVVWDIESGEEHGRIELPFFPTSLITDTTGLGAFVSTNSYEGETHLLDLEALEDVTSVPEHGVLAISRAGNALGQLLIGDADGAVAVYNVLADDTALPDRIRSGRLERLGRVEVFPALEDLPVAVTALAVDPTGQLVAIGSGLIDADETPEDYTGRIAFLDLATGLISAASVRDDAFGSFYGLAFSADGQALIVGYGDRDSVPHIGVYGAG